MKKAHERRERIVRKKGWAKIGIFSLGLFFGFLMTIGSIVGVGFWAYKNLNLNKIEKITNKSIDIGNESIKKITIEDIVSNISGITSDKNYTIAKLEDDFGITIIGEDGFIPDELYGLDLTSLKQCTLKTLDNGFEDIFGSATINTFLSFLEQSDEELGMFANIINTKIDYYYDSTNNKLCEDEGLNTEVKFEYEIVDNQVKLESDKDNTYTIENNKISVPFRTVAIESAFSSFDKVTDNLQIYKILDYHYNSNDGRYYEDENHKKELTGFMKILAPKSISDLSSRTFFDTLKLHEVFGYYYDGTNYYNYYDGTNYTEQVTLEGIEKALAQKSIDDLTSDTAFDDVYIYDVLNLHKNADGKYCEKGSDTPVTGVLNAIAGKTISGLTKDDAFNDISIYEVMNYTRTEVSEGVYTYTDSKGNPVTSIMATLAGSTVNNIEETIKTVKLGDALGISEDDASGVIKTFYSTEIGQLNSVLNPDSLYIYQALGYTQNGTTYTDSKGNPVTGIMATLASATLNNVSDKINDIKVTDVLEDSSPIIKLLDDGTTNMDEITIGNLSTAVVNKMNVATVGELIDCGLIKNVTLDTNDKLRTVTIKTLIEFASDYSHLLP